MGDANQLLENLGYLVSAAFGFSVLGFIYFVINAVYEYVIGLNRMRGTSSIQGGAEVVSVTPKKAGFERGSHFDAIVKFADGSQYRTNIGRSRFDRTWYGRKYVEFSYNELDVKDAVFRAVDAHEKAALGIREPVNPVRTLAEWVGFSLFGGFVTVGAFAVLVVVCWALTQLLSTCSASF